MKELRRYLNEFLSYCQGKNIYFADELTPAFMKTYADHRCMDDKPTLKKAVVWSLRVNYGTRYILLGKSSPTARSFYVCHFQGNCKENERVSQASHYVQFS